MMTSICGLSLCLMLFADDPAVLPAVSDGSASTTTTSSGVDDRCAPGTRSTKALLKDASCTKEYIHSVNNKIESLYSSKTSLASDLLQAVGQVVLDRAAQAGWDLLAKRLRALACESGSEDQPGALATCAVLSGSQVRIQDLLAQPNILMRAIMQDWITQSGMTMPIPLVMTPSLLGLSPERLLDAWQRNGVAGLSAAVNIAFADAMRDSALKPGCESIATSPMPNTIATLWVMGRWLALDRRVPLAEVVDACEGTWLDAKERVAIVQIISAHGALFSADREPATLARETANLVFELLKLDIVDRADEIADLQDVVIGMIDGDWTRVTTGAIRRIERRFVEVVSDKVEAGLKGKLSQLEILAIRGHLSKELPAVERPKDLLLGPMLLAALPKSPSSTVTVIQTETRSGSVAEKFAIDALKQRDRHVKLIGLLTGVTRYAATYKMKDPATTAAARKDAIADLVSQMASRRERTRGTIISLGGSVGGVVGCRGEVGMRCKDGVWTSPVHLGVGFALDSYHPWRRAAKDMGVHAEVSILDLGQYVVFNDSTPDLKRPEVGAALAPSVKLGWRFMARATPVFVAAHAAISPFVITKTDQMTYAVGAIVGVYIPFVDFN